MVNADFRIPDGGGDTLDDPLVKRDDDDEPLILPLIN